MKKTTLLLTTLLIVSGTAIPALALVEDTDVQTMDFRFNNPGARANALGGAFIGVADDATAAYTNPAGLTILTEAEISIEGKYANNTNRIYENNSHKDYTDETFGASFLSAVFPRDKTTIAIYRQQFLNTDTTFTFGQAQNKVDLNGNIYGLAVGLKANKMINLGLSVGFAQLDYFFDARKENQPVPSKNFIHQVDGSDSSEYYAASMLFTPIDSLSLGLVYRYGPEFDTTMTIIQQDGLVTVGSVTFPVYTINNIPNHLKVPDVYGAGLSWRPTSSITLAVDYNRIKYSQLADDLRLLPIHSNIATTDEFKVDDANEYHAGVEYVFEVAQLPFALRAGYYFRPDHRFYYTGTNSSIKAMYHEGEDENIFSGGFGMVLKETIQLDVAAMIGELTEEYTMSVVYRY